jgi:hypothetical protein
MPEIIRGKAKSTTFLNIGPLHMSISYFLLAFLTGAKLKPPFSSELPRKSLKGKMPALK